MGNRRDGRQRDLRDEFFRGTPVPRVGVELGHREHVRRGHRVYRVRVAGGDGGAGIMLERRREGFFLRQPCFHARVSRTGVWDGEIGSTHYGPTASPTRTRTARRTCSGAGTIYSYLLARWTRR